ncbi:MAG: nuclear transport factor 2 family protein [Novosphingobium sp.]
MAQAPDFADWLAIANLKAAYCRLLDTKDWEGWGQLFTEDFELDVTGSGGDVTVGRDAVVASVRGSIETAKTAHQVHFPEIAIDGDEASAVWPMQDRVVWEGERALTGYGHYHERYVRTKDGWRIAQQKLTRLQMDFD